MRFPFLSKRITPLLPITIILFLVLISVIYFIPPTVSVPFLHLPILYIVFFLIFLVCFGFGTLIFKTRTHGFLLSLYVICFLLLRLNDLKHPLFFIILTALFITSEFFFSQSAKHAPKEDPEKTEDTKKKNKEKEAPK